MWSTTENLKLIFNFHCDEFLLTRLLLLEALSLRLEEMPEDRKNEFKTVISQALESRGNGPLADVTGSAGVTGR